MALSPSALGCTCIAADGWFTGEETTRWENRESTAMVAQVEGGDNGGSSNLAASSSARQSLRERLGCAQDDSAVVAVPRFAWRTAEAAVSTCFFLSPSFLLSSQFFEEQADGFYAVVEVGDVELFVGGVEVVVGEA